MSLDVVYFALIVVVACAALFYAFVNIINSEGSRAGMIASLFGCSVVCGAFLLVMYGMIFNGERLW